MSVTATGWSTWWVRRNYRTSGWTDPGEERLFATLLPLPPGTRVLDVGVGGGRTTEWLRPEAASYVGIDTSGEMLAMARRRFPDAALRFGDACDLSAFGDGSLDLVVFSFNGIDCLAHDDRLGFLAAARRCLAKEGRLVFSTLNLDGGDYARQPRLPGARSLLEVPGLQRKVKRAVRLLAMYVPSRRHFARTRLLAQDHGEWAYAPMATHQYRFCVHFTRLSAVLAEVRGSGLQVVAAWSSSGRPVDLSQQRHADSYAHFLCTTAARDTAPEVP